MREKKMAFLVSILVDSIKKLKKESFVLMGFKKKLIFSNPNDLCGLKG